MSETSISYTSVQVDRKAAEQEYTVTAFDYCRNPVGSRDWTLYWQGWQAARRAALPVAPLSDLRVLKINALVMGEIEGQSLIAVLLDSHDAHSFWHAVDEATKDWTPEVGDDAAAALPVAQLWDAFIARLQANHPNERKLVNFIGSIDGYREEFLQAARALPVPALSDADRELIQQAVQTIDHALDGALRFSSDAVVPQLLDLKLKLSSRLTPADPYGY